MNSFVCKIRTPQGQITKVVMNENDKITCIKKLKRNGITPISIEKKLFIPSFKSLNKHSKKQKKVNSIIHTKKKKTIDLNKNINISFSNKVSLNELKKFTKELYLLRKSDFTNSRALIAIIKNTNNVYFKQVLNKILKSVEAGNLMYKTMNEYSDIFSPVYVNFIKTGELTGNLNEYLKHSINYLNHEVKIKEKIRNDVMPSVVMFIVMIILLIISTLFVIPNFEKIIKTTNDVIELPKITSFIINVIKFITKFWYLFVALIITVIFGIIKFINTDKGRYKYDYFKYTNVLFGKITYLIEFSRVIKSIFLNLQSKMRIQDALEISKNTITNTYMISKVEDAINNLYIGKSWIIPFEETKILNSIIIEMMKKSEKNNLSKTLGKTIEYLDDEIENQVEILLKRLTDISHVLISVTLLLFLILFLIPCIKLYLGGFLFI